jgi:hypothetical protein
VTESCRSLCVFHCTTSFTSKNRPTFQYDQATDISKPTNKMSNYRDRVPCFAGLPGGGRVYHAQILWRSRLPRSILPRKLIILGLFRFINSCAGSVGNFRCTPSDTFWAAQDTSMSRVLAFKVKRVSRATLSGATFYGFRAAFQTESAGISERN